MLAGSSLRAAVRVASLAGTNGSGAAVLGLLSEACKQTGFCSGRGPANEVGAMPDSQPSATLGVASETCCSGTPGAGAHEQYKSVRHVGPVQHWTMAGDGRCGTQIISLNEAGWLHPREKQAVYRRPFHSTSHLTAKRKKSDDDHFQSEFFHYRSFVGGKKVNNKASHKKQKRMEAKARLAEIRDWLNSLPKSGWTFSTYQVSRPFGEEPKASETKRARQSRRDRQKVHETEWVFEETFRTWQQAESKSPFFEDLGSGFFWGFDNTSDDHDPFHEQRATQTPKRGPVCPHRKCLELPQQQPLTLATLKEAFRKQALKWHPDRHSDTSKAGAEERFKEVVTAYQALKVMA